jgi:septal ring factor EnvC (AmiA/AmiB activator)
MAQQRIESNERPALLQLQRLDQHQLRAEELQLHEHQQQLQALRGEAEGLKRQLASLPTIATEQVRQLRQAEQALAPAARPWRPAWRCSKPTSPSAWMAAPRYSPASAISSRPR